MARARYKRERPGAWQAPPLKGGRMSDLPTAFSIPRRCLARVTADTVVFVKKSLNHGNDHHLKLV
jgi:hypothetical protein